jgi:hypothetical protein
MTTAEKINKLIKNLQSKSITNINNDKKNIINTIIKNDIIKIKEKNDLKRKGVNIYMDDKKKIINTIIKNVKKPSPIKNNLNDFKIIKEINDLKRNRTSIFMDDKKNSINTINKMITNLKIPSPIINNSNDYKIMKNVKTLLNAKNKPVKITKKEQLESIQKTNSSLKNTMIANIKNMYENNQIKKFSSIQSLVKLITEGKFNEYDEKMNKIEKKQTTIKYKEETQRIAKESNNKILQKESIKYITRIKDAQSEAPTFEVDFKNKDYKTFSQAWKNGVHKLIKIAKIKVVERSIIKIAVGVRCLIKKKDNDYTNKKGISFASLSPGKMIYQEIFTHTEPERVYSSEEVESKIKQNKGQLLERFKKTMSDQLGSGWVIDHFMGLFITTYNIPAARGGSYIETPQELKNSKFGLINIKNDDDECFKYCLLYHQSQKIKHNDRTSVLRKIEDKYNWDNVNYPVNFKDIETFEHNNKVYINIYGYDSNKQINPIRLGHIPYIKNDNINLLLIKDENDKGHYLYIKKIESLLHTYTNNHYKDRAFCPECGKTIGKDEIFEKHMMDKHYNCKNNCNLSMPPEGAIKKFTQYKNMMERPFIVYADFECSLIPTGHKEKIAKHEPNSAAMYFVCTFDDTRNKYYQFDGVDCVKNMIKKLREISKICLKEQHDKNHTLLNSTEKKEYNNAFICQVCSGPFNNKRNYKVQNHCMKTGEFKGAAHAACNINNFNNNFLPVVFHNLRGYDSHLIVKQGFDLLNDTQETEKIDVLANSGEKFMTFSIGKLKFIDSCQFMASSLEKLAESLKMKNGDEYEKFHHMKKFFTPEQMPLICQKGFYPYEFIDSIDKINHPELPPITAFYSNLKLEGITKEDYKHAQNVYNKFGCSSFKNYHDLYLLTDVILLSDIFENFRKMSLKYYKLDAANYLTSSSMAWDAMLLYTNIKLELISDEEILIMIEKSKRGGLCFVGSKRHAKANNIQMDKLYNKNIESSYISYIDANNLYGWAMCQMLPYKDIKWADINKIKLDDILNTSDDSETGYFIECDLIFPRGEIHKKLKQFPPCPESRAPNENLFSDYQKKLMKENGANTKNTKLIPHLEDHISYVLHYKNLKFIHNLGVQIKNITRIISFTQKEWLKPYITLNNDLRTEAKKNEDEFLTDFFKLMNNSVFGKTMEDVRNRMNMKITNDPKVAIKCFGQLDFKHHTYIDGLYLIQTNKKELVMDKPVYVGCSILDLSKVRMLDFHYNVMEKDFQDKYDLIYSDTDSLVYHVRNENFYKWCYDNSSEFDLSNMDNRYFKNENNNVLGKFKSEVKSDIITEFIALSPKSYAYNYMHFEVDKKTKEIGKFEKIKTTKKAKGVSKSVTDKTINIGNYIKVLETGEKQKRIVYSIRSFNQQLFTTKTEKICLTAYYDKMKLIDSINCEPFGYNPINN